MNNSIVRIKCGNSYGTAFYINKNLLLTACHTFDSPEETDEIDIIDDNDYTIKGTLEKSYQKYDLALIKIVGCDSTEHLKLIAHHVRINEKISSYGFPDQYSKEGLPVQGKAVLFYENQPADVRMECGSVDTGVRYDGMSGAPVIWNNMVCGVVVDQNGKDLAFISILKVFKALSEDGIQINEDIDVTSLPQGLQEDVNHSQPNYSVFSDIDENVKNSGKWHLLYGSPGSGKTTLVASYSPIDESIVILGRYFFKVPADSISSAVRCSERHFLEWLESTYIKYTNNNLEVLSLDKIKEKIPIWLKEISYQLNAESKIGVLIIDGLDELVNKSSNSIESFMRILNFKLPDNIILLLSCTSKDILPSSVIAELPNQNCIEVRALDLNTCERYILNNTGDWVKPYSFIQKTAHKTGGHPLYMNYLCKYISTNFSKNSKEEELAKWIDSLPSIEGNIETYYNMLWQKVNTDGDSVEILATLSQVRESITEEQLIGMLTQNSFAFKTNIDHLKFLLKTQKEDSYEFYHNSFSLYISETLPIAALMDVNDQIVSYCKQNPESQYAIQNELHHKLNGHNYISALMMCDQNWADTCSGLDVSPDLVLHDIRECLAKAVEQCLINDIARLMLLAQRIEFRYDKMFVEFAASLAEINISLGKPDITLRYLIRENNLIVSESEAVKYLRQLYDLGFTEQANALFDAVEAKFKRSLSVKKGETMTAEPFIAFGEASVELMKYSKKLGEIRFFEYLKSLNNIRNKEHDENSIEFYSYILSVVNSYYMASRMRFGYVPNYDVIEKESNLEWSNEFSEVGFRALYFYNVMNDQDNREVKDNEYFSTLSIHEQKLIKYKLDYSKEELCVILNILLNYSHNSNLTKDLISKFNPSDNALNIREHNGVDVNWKAIVACSENLRYIGYIDDQVRYPNIDDRKWNSEVLWEQCIIDIIKRIAYIYGHLCKIKADSGDILQEYKYLIETLNGMSFTFIVRSRWQRSYLIPEYIFPYVYAEIAKLYRDFYPDKIEDFMEYITRRSVNQLSLFREGYVQSIFNIIDCFTERKCFSNEVAVIAYTIKDFILKGVLNRYERTQALLKLVHIFNLIGDSVAGRNVYQEALNTSMGPDWYKEAQMGLLNKLSLYGAYFSDTQANHIASIYDAAAGEMTFQRYVQQEQNSFVGNLVKSCSLEDAIDYYKFETLPHYEVINHNAEDWNVDMLSEGYGYDLGANHLIEASAMGYLLENITGVSPYIKYALCELFWDNDENFRYGDTYAKIHKQIIDELGVNDSINELVPRMVEYFIKNIKGKQENEYLKYLVEYNVPKEVLDSFQNGLKENGYSWARPIKRERVQSEVLTWDDKLKEQKDVIGVLKEANSEIISPQVDYWYTMEKLFDVISSKAPVDTVSLSNIFLNHFDLIVRPTCENIAKFNFLKGYNPDNNEDSVLIKFLVWFLLHPLSFISERAKKALLWLVNYKAEVVSILVDETIHESELGMAVCASELLVDITRIFPQKVLDEINRSSVDVISRIHNISVSRNFYEIGKVLSYSLNDFKLQLAMENVIPEKSKEGGDVLFEQDEVKYIDNILDKMNDMHLLDKEFAKSYINDVNTLGHSKIIQLLKADKYIGRSFFLKDSGIFLYKRVMMNIINRHLFGKVDRHYLDDVYFIINS